jgi:hypothetical protein
MKDKEENAGFLSRNFIQWVFSPVSLQQALGSLKDEM